MQWNVYENDDYLERWLVLPLVPGCRVDRLLSINDIIAPTEQERQERVRYATGGPGGIPRWARILKEREEREGAKVKVEDGTYILIWAKGPIELALSPYYPTYGIFFIQAPSK